jgi:hypothetical protein
LSDPILWASILEDRKLSGVFGGYVIWILEEFKFDLIRIFHVRLIHLVHLLHLVNKKGRAISFIEGGKATEDL